MRLQRALARAGAASRRGAEVLIAEGRVTVNGTTATIGQSVDPNADDIRVDGKKLSRTGAARWFVLHKPVGVLTTRRDPGGRRTVFDLVPDVPGLTYVGRLDYLTEGVLLFTTDGAAAHTLTHPSGGVARTYVATVRGDAPAAADRAREGVKLDDGIAHPEDVRVRRQPGGTWSFEVTLREGRHREVRRLCDALGLHVDRLVRTAYGGVTVAGLGLGEWRELRPSEVARLAVRE